MLNQETAKAARTDSGYILRAPRRMRVADAVAQYMRVCVAGRLRASPPVVVPYCLRNRMALNRTPTAPAHPVRIWGRKPHRRLITALNPRITLVHIPIVLAVRLLQPVHIPIR